MKWRSFFRGVFIFFGLLYALMVYLLTFLHPDDYIRCDLYTEEMNGGIHFFQGKDYRIELCGLHGHIDPTNLHHDQARLHVFSMEGELLAERFFEISWNFCELEYADDYLIYNDGGGSGVNTKMSMPPSRWDWIRARLPRMWP